MLLFAWVMAQRLLCMWIFFASLHRLPLKTFQAHTEVPENVLPGTEHCGYSKCAEGYPLKYGGEMKDILAPSTSAYCNFFFALAFVPLAFGTSGSEVFAIFCSSTVACILA